MVEHSPFKSSLVYRAYWRLQINRDLLLGFGRGFLLGRVTQTPLQLCQTGRTALPGPTQPCVETHNGARPRQLHVRAGELVVWGGEAAEGAGISFGPAGDLKGRELGGEGASVESLLKYLPGGVAP